MESMNENLKDQIMYWCDDAKQTLEDEAEHVKRKERQVSGFFHLLNAVDDLVSELDKKDDALERLQSEIDQQAAEIEDLRQQLLEAREENLKLKEGHHRDIPVCQEPEPSTRPVEIHNHFEPGSSAQVFNNKVKGHFKDRKKKWKKT